MAKNGRCLEALNNSTREECCANFGVATAWSKEVLGAGALFFWRVLGGGVPCSPCKDTCDDVDCGKDKVCVVKGGRPRCVCSPKCGRSDPNGKRYTKGPVCGTDGRSYKNSCRLRKRSCRLRNTNLAIAYHGTCQSQ
ncbi:PREDICTED: follistatin-like [Nicrophorus vespilloides]|uniref:Follistatin-like n=1 Tax=Nicrophorus vespilloides TaxID=110193 RepID=A0ABM1MDZ5_NICVS|nr:PREDICTED: follistatin-like [Nicrophorus vespilloides]